MGAGERVQAPPRVVATAARGRQSQEPGKEAGWQQGQQLEPGCWSSVCGVSPAPPTPTPILLTESTLPLSPKLPTTFQEPGYCFSISLIRPVIVLLAPISLPAPPLWCCLPGAVVGDQNITARIGKPLVLNCKGAPKKPPQQLEWKLNTGRTEAWKVLSPQGGPWDSVARVLPNGSLLLPAVGIQDEGTFRCQAMSRNGKETKSNYRVRVYQIPGKPEIVDPASELMAGVPSKVGTCVSKGGYPAGTLSWHLDGKTLIPDGKGVSVKEETKRHPETGLFTLRSELMVTPARGGAPHPTFSCSFSPGLPRRRALHTAPIQLRVWEPVPQEEVLLVVEPEGGAVAPGGTVTLTCEAPAQPPPQIHWIKDVSDLERGLAGSEIRHWQLGGQGVHGERGRRGGTRVSDDVEAKTAVWDVLAGVLRVSCWGFLGGAVVESPPADAGHTALCPGPGRSHMPRSGWAREPWPLSLRVRTEPVLRNGRGRSGERPAYRKKSLLSPFPHQGMPLPLPTSSVLLLPEVGPEDQGTYSCVATHPSHGPQESHAVSVSIIGSVEGPELGTLALALGILGGLGTAALLIGVIMWQRRQRRGEERKVPENQEEEEERRTELNQPEGPEAAESSAGGP
ncbi:advanced glycosylation end product-specific receptor isoform X2 [Delphinapterus leucas]|uniref:Advanced glycosylation end product-specific receptor n=1 Tax=Delphinapterus leucas TaxID=9749 RepID=A0A2Y9MMU4_DELLE|nr:advanced glycosylation end product-specific receptor isoform X2 [Delphinapterus leucas]